MSFFVSKEIENLIDKDAMSGKVNRNSVHIIKLKFENFEHEYNITSIKNKSFKNISIKMFLEKDAVLSVIENFKKNKTFKINLSGEEYNICFEHCIRKIKYCAKRNKYLIKISAKIKGEDNV